VRRLRRLTQKRSLRWSEGVCVLEGPDLVLAALASPTTFEAIYLAEDAPTSGDFETVKDLARQRGVAIFSLASGVMEKVADAATPQPVLATVSQPVVDLASMTGDGVVLVLHDLRDPGNAGTLVRSADAAGCTGVVFTGLSVDPTNPKTLRATAGSIFHLPVAVASLETAVAHFASRHSRIYATVVAGGRDHRGIDFTRPSVIVVGNEAQGLSDDDIARCDESITIAMAGKSESLNAGVAGSLILFEAMWQRQGTPKSR
jgi:TrmH family RNA methyltransferase